MSMGRWMPWTRSSAASLRVRQLPLSTLELGYVRVYRETER
jgi:hypothetical protein